MCCDFQKFHFIKLNAFPTKNVYFFVVPRSYLKLMDVSQYSFNYSKGKNKTFLTLMTRTVLAIKLSFTLEQVVSLKNVLSYFLCL